MADKNRPEVKKSEWMANLDPLLHHIPINQLIIPGSHDSGAFELYLSKGIGVDRPDLQQNFFFNPRIFSVSAPVLHSFSVTQEKDIFDQLMDGVRYFDFRIGLRNEDEQFYIVHNLYGPKINFVTEQIVSFLSSHPKEILIIDIQHAWGLRDIPDFQRLFNIFDEKIGHFMLKKSSLGPDLKSLPSLRNFWDLKKSIMLIWRVQDDSIGYEIPSKFWHGKDHIDSPWPNTTNCNQLRRFLQSKWEERKNNPIDPNRIFVSQAVLTPNFWFVLGHVFGDLRRLSLRAQKMLALILAERPDSIRFSNVIMIDFVGEFDRELRLDLIQSIIDCNRLLIRED